MKMNMLAAADALSSQDLLAHLDVLAGRERSASAELVAHLASLESRPGLYAGKGYGSLFCYCTQALRLSEDAACNRIEAAKACRRFPVVLDLLASGSLTLTSVRILSPHLTPENHEAVLERAKGRARRQIEGLVAELAPRPDVSTSIRKLPTLTAAPAAAAPPIGAATGVASEPATQTEPSRLVFHPPARPIIQATAPGRYLSAPGRIRRTFTNLVSHPATSRRRSGAPSLDGTVANVLSFLPTAGGAPSARSWNSTTFSPTQKGDRPPWRTSPFGAGGTTSTRRKWNSAITALPACARSEKSLRSPRGAWISRPRAGSRMSCGV